MLDERHTPALVQPDAAILAEAVEASDVSVTIADLTQADAPLIFVNQAFLTMTGYERTEIVGRNCRFLQGPDTDPDAVTAMREAIAAGRSLRVDILNYRKCGEAFWNALHLSPLHDAGGAVRGYVGMQSDVTKVRAAREAEEHRQRIEALGRMAGAVAHEINNLLQPLVSLPELVADELPPGAGRARSDLDLIARSARDARDLLGEVLTFTRTAGADGAPIAFAPAFAAALELARLGLPEGVTLTVDGAAPDGAAVAGLSRAGLQQILTNLLLNAADAMGGVGAVRIHLGGDVRQVTLSVTDEGPGLPPETQKRIFEPFFTTKAPGAGVGLGLYIVHQLAERAGGRVSAEAGAGGGARFLVRLPRAGF